MDAGARAAKAAHDTTLARANRPRSTVAAAKEWPWRACRSAASAHLLPPAWPWAPGWCMRWRLLVAGSPPAACPDVDKVDATQGAETLALDDIAARGYQSVGAVASFVAQQRRPPLGAFRVHPEGNQLLRLLHRPDTMAHAFLHTAKDGHVRECGVQQTWALICGDCPNCMLLGDEGACPDAR